MTLLEVLQKIASVLDQVLVGRGRVVSNIQYGVKVVQAVRQADLGTDTNAVLDEVIVIGQKVEQIAGAPSPVPPVVS